MAAGLLGLGALRITLDQSTEVMDSGIPMSSADFSFTFAELCGRGLGAARKLIKDILIVLDGLGEVSLAEGDLAEIELGAGRKIVLRVGLQELTELPGGKIIAGTVIVGNRALIELVDRRRLRLLRLLLHGLGLAGRRLGIIRRAGLAICHCLTGLAWRICLTACRLGLNILQLRLEGLQGLVHLIDAGLELVDRVVEVLNLSGKLAVIILRLVGYLLLQAIHCLGQAIHIVRSHLKRMLHDGHAGGLAVLKVLDLILKLLHLFLELNDLFGDGMSARRG